jgi:hypothetical protein
MIDNKNKDDLTGIFTLKKPLKNDLFGAIDHLQFN